MKKIITICLLAITLLMGGMALDAKTTKETAKTSQSRKRSSSFTVKSFMEKAFRGYQLKDLKPIKSILTSNGYKYEGSEHTLDSGHDIDTYTFKDLKGNKVAVVVISDKEIGVVDDVNEIIFTFINSTERDKFTKKETIDSYGAHDQVIINVDGNTVKLSDDCYYW